MSYSAAYEFAFDWLMGIEGFYSNHPRDRGGETAWGISRRFWPQYWERGTPTREQAREFYWREFWTPLRCPEIVNRWIAQELFEGAVVAGHVPAVRWLQLGVNAICFPGRPRLAVDDKIGPKTIAESNWYGQRYPAALFNTVNVFQGMHFLMLENPDFVRGWMAKRIQAQQG